MIAAGALIVIETRDLAEVDAAEQRLHVVERVDRDALAADLAQLSAGGRSRGPSGSACRRRWRDPVCPWSSR